MIQSFKAMLEPASELDGLVLAWQDLHDSPEAYESKYMLTDQSFDVIAPLGGVAEVHTVAALHFTDDDSEAVTSAVSLKSGLEGMRILEISRRLLIAEGSHRVAQYDAMEMFSRIHLLGDSLIAMVMLSQHDAVSFDIPSFIYSNGWAESIDDVAYDKPQYRPNIGRIAYQKRTKQLAATVFAGVLQEATST